MFPDEVVIEDRSVPIRRIFLVELEHDLGYAHDGCGIAANLELMILRCDPSRLLDQHFSRRLRIHEFNKPPLAKRIEGDNRHAGFHGLLELVQNARTGCPHILTEEKNALGMGKVVESAGADRHTYALRECYGRG